MSVWTSTGEGPVNPRAWLWLAVYCTGGGICAVLLWAVTVGLMTGWQALMCAALAAALYLLPRHIPRRRRLVAS